MGSLIVAGYDLLDPASSVRLLMGTDLGDGQADTSTVARLLLDGEVVTGRRTSNRVLSLPVLVETGSRSGDAKVLADLARAVDQQAWSVPWVPADGEPAVVFDCYRGQLERNWSVVYQATVATLTVPAAPFTRDAQPVQLGSNVPTTSLDTFDSTDDLVVELPFIYADAGPFNETQSYFSGMVSNSYSLDTSTRVTGSGSVKVLSPLYRTSFAGTSNFYCIWHFVQGALASVSDLSQIQTLTWSAMADVKMDSDSWPFARLPNIQSSIDPSQAEVGFNAKLPKPYTWTVTLIDSNGNRSRWDSDLIGLEASWRRYSVNLQALATAVDDGFDITRVVGWRLRYCGIAPSWTPPNSLPTPEMAQSGILSNWPTENLLNCTVSDAKGVGYVGGDGIAEASMSQSYPVTAGTTYSGSAAIGSFRVGASPLVTMQFGLEWLDGDGAALSVDWSAVETRNIGTIGYRSYVTGTAPSGAVAVRGRFRWLTDVIPAGTGSYLLCNQASDGYLHLNEGDTCWLYPYADVPAAALWIDNLVAYPAGSGSPLTGPYALQPFQGIQGAARTPLSVIVNANNNTEPTRLLLATTPNPAEGFTPFLDVPSSVTTNGQPTGPTSDTDALTGRSYGLTRATTAAGRTTARYTLPAHAYGSTYAVLARIKRTNAYAVAPTLTAYLDGDTDNSASCSRTFATTGADADTLPVGEWHLVAIGSLTLPPRQPAGQNTGVNMILDFTDTGGQPHDPYLYLDMLVLVDLAGEMILVDSPDGHDWYWLDAPDSTQLTGSVMGGSVSDRTDAVSMAPYLSGQPVIHAWPGSVALTVLLDQAGSGGTVDLSYYPRWQGERPA